MSEKRDYYDVLGVSKTATPDEIKKAFRKKARECHPDVNKTPEAEGQFKELGEAYEVLSDAKKRQTYDAYGHAGLGGAGYQPSWNFTDSFPDLNDLFSQFFGGGVGFGGGGQPGGPMQGEHLRFDLQISFMDAAFGVTQDIDVAHWADCNTCHGSGASPESGGPSPCGTCGGQGQVQQVTQTFLGQFAQITTCPQCQGRGHIITDPCKTCEGQGRQRDTKTLEVTIPPGVDSGTRLRVSGEGDAGYHGGPPGDLYVMIYVEEHSLFKRNNTDVFTTFKASYTQLALGDTVTISLLKGEHELKIPAGTQPGDVFTVRGEGIPVLNQPKRRGDFHVQVILDVPKKIDAETRKHLEALRDIEKGSNVSRKTTDAKKPKWSLNFAGI